MPRIRAYEDFTWKGNDLYLGKKYCGRIVPDGIHKNMWWVQLPDGETIDFYNKTRAKDNLIRLNLALENPHG